MNKETCAFKTHYFKTLVKKLLLHRNLGLGLETNQTLIRQNSNSVRRDYVKKEKLKKPIKTKNKPKTSRPYKCHLPQLPVCQTANTTM